MIGDLKKCYLRFYVYPVLFFIFLFYYLFTPTNAYATTVYDGHLELRMQTGSYNGINDGSAVSPEWLSGTFPNGNYIIIPGSSDLNYNGYWFVKYFNLYFTSDTNFNVGQTYALEIDFNYGSYITWTDFYGWRMISDRNLTYCAGGNSSSNLSQCSMVWNPTNDGSSSTMTLLYRPDTTSSGFGVSIGSMENQHFVMWNRFGDPQGFKVNQVRITSTQNSGTPSQDFTAVINAIEDVKDNIDNNTQAIEDNTQAIEDLQDDLKDETPPDVDGFFDDIQLDESNSPVTDLITMPLTLLSAYINGISGSCSRYSFGTLLGTELYLPCINPSDYIGSTLWGVIDLLICIFLCYEIAMLCISIYESLTSLDDGFYSLYKPKHAASEYQPKHGGGN